MQYSKEEVHAFLKNEASKQKTSDNNDDRYEKYKQSQLSYKQIKSIEMIDERRSQIKNVP